MEPVTFDTADGLTLEGELRRPDQTPRGAAVLCHPHPRHGGSKDHPLLWALRIGLASRGFTVLSFNFRGVMGSEGEYGGGEQEVADVEAAVSLARSEADGPLFVCGWSFGANVALRSAVRDPRIDGLALIGFPLSESSLDLPPLPDDDELSAFRRPVLLLAGDADQYCPVPELEWLARRLPDATVEIVAGADHYFGKREREAADIVAGFAERLLKR